jgi:hypothetical protein
MFNPNSSDYSKVTDTFRYGGTQQSAVSEDANSNSVGVHQYGIHKSCNSEGSTAQINENHTYFTSKHPIINSEIYGNTGDMRVQRNYSDGDSQAKRAYNPSANYISPIYSNNNHVSKISLLIT